MISLEKFNFVLRADLVFVSLEPWDEIWRRNQFLCAGLLARHPEMRILFVEPPRDVSNAVRSGRWELVQPAGTPPVEFSGRLQLYRPVKLLPNGSRAGRRFNEWLARRQIRAEMRRIGIERPLLWINAHYAGHLVGRLGERAVIYDITDDWTELKQCARGAALIRQQDATLCQTADSVIVCSERLAELKMPLCSGLHLIPNGVDPEHYRCVLDGSGPLPGETAAWARPVFGYTGTVHAERLDLALVEDVARRLPRGSIVLLGPSHLLPEQAARLRACGNVHLPGPVPYARIPEFMRAFDACIVPHRVTAFTESLNPIKLWEYLAAGKPIVSTNVAGFRDYAAVVSIARSAEEFVRAMQAALDEPASAGVARRELVRAHSWEARLDQVEAVLATCGAGGVRQELPVTDKERLESHAPPADARLELTLSAIIVSYNTRELTLQCLRSLMAALERLAAEVWVVDNGSTDGSVAAIRASFPAVKLIEAGKNLGFGAANNLAMRRARGKYLLLLNSDAFPRPGAIDALVAHLEAHPEAGVAGPRLANEDGTLQRSCFRFPSPLQAWLENLWITRLFPPGGRFGDYYAWDHGSEREVDFVIGACLLARREVYEQVGGFDEGFFMYQEEADWERRIQDAGWKIAFTPAAEVVHLGGASGKPEPARINRHFFESLDLYSLKHHGRAGFLATRAAMLVGCSLRALLWGLVAMAPRRRARALSKMRKHLGLVTRQLMTRMPAMNAA